MSNPSQYLESKVLTASQPQLHIMLLDGALRFGKQAKESWAGEAGFVQAQQPLERMFDIVEELLQGLASGEGEFSTQLAEQYAFIYRQLAESRINQEIDKLDSCLKLLAYQRETWKLAIEQLETQVDTTSKVPTVPHLDLGTTQANVGLSLEA